MADLLDDLLIDSAPALLRAGGMTNVYPDANGNVPDDHLPAAYVRWYGYIERPFDNPDNPLNGTTAMWTVHWIFHCVSAGTYGTARSAVSIAMQVDRLIRDQRPSVSGRSCGLIRQETAVPPTLDTSTGTPVYDAVAGYFLPTGP